MVKRKKRKAPVPLAPSRITRKQARRITTEFHRLAHSNHDESSLEALRADYQRASQVSTSFFSTSKWVLGCLIQKGWFYGIPIDIYESTKPESKKKKQRRNARLLEIGAINTELLDAADDTTRGAKVSVRAIDIHSMHYGRIEEQDFLTMEAPDEPFDVIVCSMVLNCVATPEDRGRMILRMHQFLRPDGLLYLTIPKTCLELSPFIDKRVFERILGAAGFQVQDHSKESPKIAFFVATRAKEPPTSDSKWTKLTRMYRGSQYRNQFAVILPKSLTVI